MRADEERFASVRPPRGDILIRLLAGFLEEIELVGQPIRQFAFDVNEPGIDIRANDHTVRAHAFPPVCLLLRTRPIILGYTAHWQRLGWQLLMCGHHARCDGPEIRRLWTRFPTRSGRASPSPNSACCAR